MKTSTQPLYYDTSLCLRLTGLSRTTWWRWVHRGVLPQPADVIDNDMEIYDNEVLIDVQTLNIDSASFTEIERRANGDIEEIKKTHGDISVIVHPECTPDVVNLSDHVGSTSYIKSTIEAAAAGTKWAVGTEVNFVNCLKADNPDKLIVPLRECECRDMSHVTLLKFLTVLENILEGKDQPEVTVDPEDARHARVALERMLAIT